MSERTDKPALTVEQVAEWAECRAKLANEQAAIESRAGRSHNASHNGGAYAAYAHVAAAIRKGELP